MTANTMERRKRARKPIERMSVPVLDLMIDIETFGNRPTAAIQQLGWALFNPEMKAGVYPVIDSGNIFIDVDDCLKHGLTVNASCLNWWLRQSDEAREAATKSGTDLANGLFLLNRSLSKADHYWCSAPSFDYAIIENAAAAIGVALSWNRKQMLCLRTLRKFTPWLSRNDAPAYEQLVSTTHHVAEDDAKVQAVETVVRLSALERMKATARRFDRSYGKGM